MANTKTTKVKSSSVPMQAISDIPEDVDPNMIVMVRNGFHGKLIYVSPKTSEEFIWDEFGEEQEMELKELRVAKNSAKQFFANNWFMFDEEYSWVIKYLGVSQYYESAISIDGFDKLLKCKPAEIKTIISNMTDGQKESLAYEVRDMVNNEKIDSLSLIRLFEGMLGVTLIDER